MSTLFNFELLKDTVQVTRLFGEAWIIPLLLTLLIMVTLTRDKNQMGRAFLPVYLAIRTAGVYVGEIPHVVFITIGTLIYITHALSVEAIGSFIKTGVSGIKEIASGENPIRKWRQNVISKRLAYNAAVRQQDAYKLGRLVGKPLKTDIKSGGFLDLSTIRPEDTIPQSIAKRTGLQDNVMISGKKGITMQTDIGRGNYLNLETEIKPMVLKKKKKIKEPSRPKSLGSYSAKLNPTYKSPSQINSNKKQSFDTWWKKGPKKQGTTTGYSLKTAIRDRSAQLGRRLTKKEIKELYNLLGRT